MLVVMPGCSECDREDMSKETLPFTQREDLLSDSHEGASLCACRGCGRRFVRVWREVGGWEIEDIWRYWAPVTPEEEAGLRAAFAGGDDEGMARASALILARPHLVEAPTGRVGWSSASFEVGLWMHT